MKQSIIRRKNRIRNIVFDKESRKLCRTIMKPKAITRNRKIMLPHLLLSVLNKQGRNVSFEIRDFELNKKGEKMVKYTDEAYLKQRRQLNPEIFKKMNYEYLRDFYHEKKEIKKYKGYVVWAIDGSTEEIPNTENNKKTFGIGRAKKESKKSVARIMVVGAYDVYNHFFGDIAIDKANTYEPKLAIKNIEKCIKINNKQKNLFVFDRNYPSIELYEILNETFSKFVMRLSVNDYMQERSKMTSDDEIVYIKYNHYRKYHFKKKKPEIYEKIKDKDGIKLRIINIQLETGETESLITNILNKKFTLKDFQEIYNSRWKIEESFNSVKNKLKIEKITGKLPIFIYQDIYAQTLVYNQVQDMLNEGNEQLKERNKRKKLKREYHINENKAIGLYKEQFIKILLIEDKNVAIQKYDELIYEMQKYVSVIRENRKSPRIWNISNKYHSNKGATF